jgi:hypothetical protein
VFDIDGTAIGTATADASTGSFTLTTTTTLSDGFHILTATATDAAGNTGASSPAVIITINTTIPTVVIDSAIDGNGNPVPNGGWSSSNSITFRFTVSANEPGGNDLFTIYCWGIYIASDPSCKSPKTYSNLPPYRIDFNIQPSDIVGNGETATWSWTIDNIPNTIRVTDPYNGTTGVPVTSSIKALFNWEFSGSSPMDTSTFNTNTFTLKDSKNNTVSGRIESGLQCPQIESRCSIIFIPSQPLAYSTTYTATITTGVKDMAGNSLSSPVSWTFTTQAAPPT